ncbi:MAG: wax ester/triacylglycerol synthase domain-containing protein [Microthrixaceae bacterium]
MDDTRFPTEFSPSDRIMWKIERDPVLRSPVLTIGLLDREPAADAVRRTFERAVERVPRLRQRVARSGIGGRSLSWEPDPGFNLDYHLRRVRAPHPADVRAVLDIAAPFAVSALDPARPQWELTIVEGLDAGRAALILKFHHTITDGVGGVDLAGSVFDSARSGKGRSRVEARRPITVASGPPSVATRLASTAGTLARSATRPTDAASSAVRFVRSVARMLEPAPAPLSPVLRGRGLDRRLDVLEVPMAGLRERSHETGLTINALFLAAVGGALHDYHQRLGFDVPALRVTMPISLRKPGDPPGGNRFTPARFVLPIDDADPVVRAKIAGAITRRWRDEPAVGLTDVLAVALDQLPDTVVTPLFASMLRNVDVDAVDVPGLSHEAFVGGARIERLWAFAPPTGAALSVTLLSHIDTACVGLVCDRAAVDDSALLHTCMECALDEVLGMTIRARAASQGVGA